MRPALASVCSLESSLNTIFEDYAAGQCNAIDLWLGALECHLQSHSFESVRDSTQLHGIDLVAASFQGGLLISQGDARRAHWDHFTKRLLLLKSIGVPILVVAGDARGPLHESDIARLDASLREAAARASDHGIKIALEFDSTSSFPNNLQSAAAITDSIAHPSLGLCLDWHHFWTGSSKSEDLAMVTPDNLFHVQISDLPLMPREMSSDSDRILPGEGSAPPDLLIATLHRINYQGAVAIEIHNPRLWKVPPRQFGEIAMTSLRRVLGQASMGLHSDSPV